MFLNSVQDLYEILCSVGSSCSCFYRLYVQGDTKKWELLKNPTKIEEIQEKKIIDRN